jgi:predicted alpha/beta superfamily hydrolase
MTPRIPMIRLLWLLFAWSTCAMGQASTPEVSLANTEQRAVTASKTGYRYDLLISLPADYRSSEKRYPVLYVLDGWHFPLMSFLQDNNRFSGRMPPLVIVTISHGAGNVMALRARDFTPSRVERTPGSGGADAFLEFLERQVIPMIDATYRTDPADRALVGHSFGGLFALYVLEQRPALFQRIVASSPTIGWDDRKLFAASRLKRFDPPVRLDLSVEPEPRFRDDVVAFTALLDELKPNGLTYRMKVHEGEDHNSLRVSALPSGLYWVYARP